MALSSFKNDRLRTSLKKHNVTPIQYLDDAIWLTIKVLEAFRETIEHAYAQADPSQIAKLNWQLSRPGNKFYGHQKVLTNDNAQHDRLTVLYAASIILEECLNLLGIEAPQHL